MRGRVRHPEIALILLLIAPAWPTSVAAQDERSAFDDIWRFAEWYDDQANPVVQSVLFSGRFQYEYATVSDDPETYDEWNVRRLRLGARMGLFRQLTVHVEAEFNPQERDPFYMRLTDTYVEWSRSPDLAVTVGKQGVPFTMDGSTSSKELLTIDRSNVSNNMWFPQEYMPGVSVSGEASNWVYQVGAYSAGTANKEFGEFDGGFFTLALLGYDVGDAVGTDRALLRGTYVYQDPDPANTFTRQLEHVGSLNLDLEDSGWGLRADVTAAAGYLGQSDVWGTMVMPFVNVTSGLQLLTRYTRVASSDPNGVRLARYESQLRSGRGDRYQEAYLGANYYFYEHKLKLQAGVQWADMSDEAADGGSYSGVGATVGLRISW
jgi:phosphate-selective porin OprO/OprP